MIESATGSAKKLPLGILLTGEKQNSQPSYGP